MWQEHVRLDVRKIVREQNSGEASDAGAQRKGLDLEPEHGLAGGRGDDLVLADRAEHAAERRAPHALEGRVHQQHRRQHDGEIEEVVVRAEPRVERTRDPGHAVGAAREPRFVQEAEPEDFREAERHDGEVVLAQAERHHREPGAGRGRERHGRDPRQHERRAADRQQRGGIGADGEERDDAEVHEPGQSPLDVQTERQERPDADQGRDGGEVGEHEFTAFPRDRWAAPAAPAR